MMTDNPDLRASPELQEAAAELGPLVDLLGNWVGKGFNLVFLPARGSDPPFRRLINPTIELLSFSPLGSLIPNRGSKQDDIFFAGLSYTQQTTDLNTLEEIHVEAGQWLNIPETNPASGNASIVRQATILHGNALLAQGPIPPEPDPNQPNPIIGAASFMPTFVANGAPLSDAASIAVLNAPMPPGVPANFIPDPNKVLEDRVAGDVALGLKFLKTRTIQISSDPNGGILNIPFLKLPPNANVTKIDATFWIETIIRPSGGATNLRTMMQLQYTQTVNMIFDEINWPHISIATLIKQ